MARRRKRSSCRIKVFATPNGPTVAKMVGRRSVNVINYPRGKVLSSKDLARARRLLCVPMRRRKRR